MIARRIQTVIWSDEDFAEYSPTQKLLFLYYITNDKIGFTGMYRITDREVLFDTGVSQEQLDQAKTAFTLKRKIFFHNGWVCVSNAKKHNSFGGKTAKAEENEWSRIPQEVITAFNNLIEGKVNVVMDHASTIDGSTTPLTSTSNNINIEKIEKLEKTQPTSKTALLPCTPEEMLEVATILKVPLDSVERKHMNIMDMIGTGEFQKRYRNHKTVYYTLKTWVSMDIDKGFTKQIDPTQIISNGHAKKFNATQERIRKQQEAQQQKGVVQQNG